MRIEHTLKRPGGTQIPMPPTPTNPAGKTYAFKPAADDQDGPHVADVTDPVHVKRFMATEGFEMVAEGADEEPSPATKGDGEGGAGGAALAGVSLEDADLDQLRAIHLSEIGKEANARAAEDTLRSKIEAHRAEQAGGTDDETGDDDEDGDTAE